MLVTTETWSLFVATWDECQPCQSMAAGYRPVDDDPELPPYDAPCLYCTALDKLLNPTSVNLTSEDIPF